MLLCDQQHYMSYRGRCNITILSLFQASEDLQDADDSPILKCSDYGILFEGVLISVTQRGLWRIFKCETKCCGVEAVIDRLHLRWSNSWTPQQHLMWEPDVSHCAQLFNLFLSAFVYHVPVHHAIVWFSWHVVYLGQSDTVAVFFWGGGSCHSSIASCLCVTLMNCAVDLICQHITSADISCGLTLHLSFCQT